MKAAAGGGSWGVIAGLALSVAAFSVVHPALLVFIPLALFLLALPPRRPQLVALAFVFLTIAFATPGHDALWYTERGWALILAAWFVLFVVAWPHAGFTPRALGALGATVVSAVFVFLGNRGGWARLDASITGRMERGAAEVTGLWGEVAGDGLAAQVSSNLARIAELQAVLYPALLALASLAALGLAWWAYHRLAGSAARALRPLREFRFPDAFVWVAIVGAVLVLTPDGGEYARAGTNLLVFAGAMYALRGAAVGLALMGSPRLGGAILGGIVVVLLYPLVMAAAVLVGLSDTWLDLRARWGAAQGSGP